MPKWLSGMTTYRPFQWKGYLETEHTWEPKTNLTNAKQLLKTYKRKQNKNWQNNSSCLFPLFPLPTQPPLSPHHQHSYQLTINKSTTSSSLSNSFSKHKPMISYYPILHPINKLPLMKLPPYNNSCYFTISWPSYELLLSGIQWLLLILTYLGRTRLFIYISNT